jgi:hypothetical protein
VNALDWLVVCPSQGGDALWHANALVRQFVSKGKLELARSAYSKIPPELIRSVAQHYDMLQDDADDPSIPAKHKAALREHLSFQEYLVLSINLCSFVN